MFPLLDAECSSHPARIVLRPLQFLEPPAIALGSAMLTLQRSSPLSHYIFVGPPRSAEKRVERTRRTRTGLSHEVHGGFT
jgi:hypothetical protein